MARPPVPQIFVATSTGIVKVKGKEYRYLKDRTRVARGHPLLRAMPDRFKPLALDYDIERTIAAPNEVPTT